MRSGNFFGYFAQGRIARPSVFKAVFRNRDGMSVAVPFPNQSCARLQTKARSRSDPSRFPQGLGHRLDFAMGRFAEPAVFDLLQSIAHSEDKKIATDLRWITVEQLEPFETQLLKSE